MLLPTAPSSRSPESVLPPVAVSRAPRRARAFGVSLGLALAGGVALAAWSATEDVAVREPAFAHGPLLPRGAMLDRLLEQADASPTQRAQAHQILDAADADLKQGRSAARADEAEMARLFTQVLVDPVAVEGVRARVQARHDAESRRFTQALLDVSLVLGPQQRQVIVRQLAGGPRPFRLPSSLAATAAHD